MDNYIMIIAAITILILFIIMISLMVYDSLKYKTKVKCDYCDSYLYKTKNVDETNCICICPGCGAQYVKPKILFE